MADFRNKTTNEWMEEHKPFWDAMARKLLLLVQSYTNLPLEDLFAASRLYNTQQFSLDSPYLGEKVALMVALRKAWPKAPIGPMCYSLGLYASAKPIECVGKFHQIVADRPDLSKLVNDLYKHLVTMAPKLHAEYTVYRRVYCKSGRKCPEDLNLPEPVKVAVGYQGRVYDVDPEAVEDGKGWVSVKRPMQEYMSNTSCALAWGVR